MNPKISVITGIFNNAPYLPEAIESILNQTFSDFEFIVVNDGSTDDSGSILDQYAKHDKRIKCIHQANRGLVASLNLALERSTAPIIARMDGDDISHPERFARQYSHLNKAPDVGVLGTQMRFINADGVEDGTSVRYPLNHSEALKNLADGPIVSHPTVLMRRDALLKVGHYRSAYKHCEDRDLWLRLATVTHISSLPEELYTYRRYQNQVSKKYSIEQLYGALVAFEAYTERSAGRRDPTEGSPSLPALLDLNSVFNRPGVTEKIRRRLSDEIMYTPRALSGPDFSTLIDHIRDLRLLEPGIFALERRKFVRASARLIKMGEIRRAFKLITTALFSPT